MESHRCVAKTPGALSGVEGAVAPAQPLVVWSAHLDSENDVGSIVAEKQLRHSYHSKVWTRGCRPWKVSEMVLGTHYSTRSLGDNAGSTRSHGWR